MNVAALKEELERANRFIKPLIQGLAGVFLVVLFLRPPFYREFGQVMDLVLMIGFFGFGSYFRQVLHIYVRTKDISQEEIKKRYTERSLFQILGWGALFFFFLKGITMKGKMGAFWSKLPDPQMSNTILLVAFTVYFIGVLGVLFRTHFKKDQEGYACLFEAFLAFGTGFPIVWLYPRIHPYFFADLPSWIIQLPLLLLVVVNSIGFFLSFQRDIHKKILGNTCLWFVRHGEQIFAFVVLWAIVTVYAGVSPLGALVLYAVVFVLLALISRREKTGALIILIGIIAISPLLAKIYTGELPNKIEARVALVKELQQKKMDQDMKVR